MEATGSPCIPGIVLNDGHAMPAFGLGTWQGNTDIEGFRYQALEAAKNALRVGIRHFDTASLYVTEAILGEALRSAMEAGNVTREDIYVTTKLWPTSRRRELVVPSLRKSLEKVGLKYVDMYLVHWPVAMVPSEADDIFPQDENGAVMFDDEVPLTETWKGMEECKRLGLTKSIGISNFNINQIQGILESCKTSPANLQVESHPYLTNEELIEFCNTNGIAVTAYAPLGYPSSESSLNAVSVNVISDPILIEIGKKHNKTAAQVALRFQIQRGLVVIPKSNNVDRQRENVNIFDFELSKEEMAKIFQCNKNARVYTLSEQFSKSKHYPF